MNLDTYNFFPLLLFHLASHLSVVKISLDPACSFPVNLVIFLIKKVESWQWRVFHSGYLEVCSHVFYITIT